jgi:hypothetical protein
MPTEARTRERGESGQPSNNPKSPTPTETCRGAQSNNAVRTRAAAAATLMPSSKWPRRRRRTRRPSANGRRRPLNQTPTHFAGASTSTEHVSTQSFNAQAQNKKEATKAAAKQRLEALKQDPWYQGKRFGESLLNDIKACKATRGGRPIPCTFPKEGAHVPTDQTRKRHQALTSRLIGCCEAAADEYVRALTQDEKTLDSSYSELQVAIREKNLAKLQQSMSESAAKVEAFQKRFRLAKATVAAYDQIEREKQGDAQSQSSGKRAKAKK